MKLVVVGGAPVRVASTSAGVRRAADPRVIFPGYVFGRGYWELQRNAYLFCAPTEVGGTHPVILEALAAGNCVLVNDYAPNAETVGDAGVYFSGREGVPDLTRAARAAARRPRARGGLPRRARASAPSATRGTRWPTAYEQLLLEVRDAHRPRVPAARDGRRRG